MSNISLVIPTKNAGPSFRQTLEAIYAQEIPSSLEVIVVDSGSTDETLAICQDFALTLLTIPPDTFSHSGTRNEAIRHAHGDIIVLIVQDALPVGTSWLRALISPLERDPRVAGAYSRQVPRPDADLYTRRMFSIWGMSSTRPAIREITDRAAYEQMSWGEKSHLCAFSNISSAIRASVWRETPFPPVEYAEDLAWAKMVLESGYRLVYVPTSTVIHSHHHRSWMDKLRRAYIDGKTVPQIFDAAIPFPGDQALEVVVRLLEREMRAMRPFYEPAHLACLDGVERVRLLGPRGVSWLLSAHSPWMAGSSAERRREFLLRRLTEELVAGRRWGGRFYRALAAYWLWALSVPGVAWLAYSAFIGRFAPLLAQMWGPWIVFWGTLSTRVDGPLPLQLTNKLLGYFAKFLPAPEQELANLWLNVLVGGGARFLGRAAWAATSQGIDSAVIQRIEQWLAGEPSRPQA